MLNTPLNTCLYGTTKLVNATYGMPSVSFYVSGLRYPFILYTTTSNGLLAQIIAPRFQLSTFHFPPPTFPLSTFHFASLSAFRVSCCRCSCAGRGTSSPLPGHSTHSTTIAPQHLAPLNTPALQLQHSSHLLRKPKTDYLRTPSFCIALCGQCRETCS